MGQMGTDATVRIVLGCASGYFTNAWIAGITIKVSIVDETADEQARK
jgi:hypothetical protein